MALNILLVDDSDVIRTMIARTIRLAGLPVNCIREAANGVEALEVLEDEWIDLVLADLNMPVMDGVTMLERLRSNPTTADLPVIIVSTEGATQRIDGISEHRVAAWVRKPFTPEEIRDVIEGVTTHWSGHPEADVALANVFGRIVEQFAFAFPEASDGRVSHPNGDLIRADISFGGAVAGSLTVAAPASLCAEMAANAIGVDVEDHEAIRRGPDTLGELVNMTAGHLCTELEPHAPTHLQPPVVSRMSHDGWSTFVEDSRSKHFVVEDKPIALSLTLRSSVAV